MEDNEPKKKRKSGLHKEISSIFEGVPIPGKEQPSGTVTPGRAEQGPTKAEAPEPSPPTIKPRPVKQPMPKVTTGKSRLQEIWQKIKSKFLQPQEGVSSLRQKIMLALIPVLIIVLIFVFMPFFKAPSHMMPEPKETKPTEVAAEHGRKIDWKIPEPYPEGLRDPMQMRSSTTVKVEGEKVSERIARLPVKGIVYSIDNPAAVVGTQLVHEGDTISNVTIVKINQDSVEFKINSKRWTQKVE